MNKYFLIGVVCIFMLSSGCAGLVKTVKGDDKSVKKTQIAGAIVEEVKVTGIKKADMKADVKGLDLSKKTEISGGQHIEGVDMTTLMYLAGGVFGLMTAIITFMGTMLTASYRRMKEKDVIILDLANDIKEILPKVMEALKLAYETTFDFIKKK